MPTTVFGYTKRSCSSEELKKKYPFAHFENPVNIKHRLVNQWGLNMAASSRGRFNKQRDHTKWCMDERSNRLSLQLATTEAEEVSFETNYYQEKSIRFKLKTLNQKYADVKNLELGKTKQHQSDR